MKGPDVTDRRQLPSTVKHQLMLGPELNRWFCENVCIVLVRPFIFLSFILRLHTDKPKNPITKLLWSGSICAPDFDGLQFNGLISCRCKSVNYQFHIHWFQKCFAHEFYKKKFGKSVGTIMCYNSTARAEHCSRNLACVSGQYST